MTASRHNVMTMIERELKLSISESQERRLRAILRSGVVACGRPVRRTLSTIYYDTDEGDLESAGLSLRVRRQGRIWTQTVKARDASMNGLSTARELNCPAPGGRLCIDAIPDPALREFLQALQSDKPLQPCSTHLVRRTAYEVLPESGTHVEVVIDTVEVRVRDHAAQFREVEIELIEGRAQSIFTVGRALFPDGGIRFSTLSKAQRGALLAREGIVSPILEPRQARSVPLDACATVESAAQAVLRECACQITANIGVSQDSDGPSGPHQLRVGLRRLRTALAVFCPLAPGNTRSAELVAQATWLAREVGQLRDVEVTRLQSVLPELERQDNDAGFLRLSGALEQYERELRQAVRAHLVSAQGHRFLFDLIEYIELRGWLDQEDLDQTARLAEPVAQYARRVLGKRWRRVRQLGGGLASLDIEQRHELRKSLKKLRYAAEFFAPVFQKRNPRRFLRRLARLQTIFGDLNDAALVERLLSNAPCLDSDDPALQRACGWIMGARITRSEMTWRRVETLWSRLERTRVFWR